MSEEETRQKTHANAPTKTMMLELVQQKNVLVYVATPHGIGPAHPLIAHGVCPGCGQLTKFSRLSLLNELASAYGTPGLPKGKLGDSTCAECGQRAELYARTVRLVS